MTPIIGVITAGIGALSGSIGNLFTGEKRAQRQAKRQARRSTRKSRRIQKRAPVSKIRTAAAGVLDPGRITSKTEGATFDQKITAYLDFVKANWYYFAGGLAALVAIYFVVTEKKNKRKSSVGRRMAKARAAKKRGSNPTARPATRKSGTKSSGNFAARTRRVNREWKKAKAAGSKIGRKAAWAKWG